MMISLLQNPQNPRRRKLRSNRRLIQRLRINQLAILIINHGHNSSLRTRSSRSVFRRWSSKKLWRRADRRCCFNELVQADDLDEGMRACAGRVRDEVGRFWALRKLQLRGDGYLRGFGIVVAVEAVAGVEVIVHVAGWRCE